MRRLSGVRSALGAGSARLAALTLAVLGATAVLATPALADPPPENCFLAGYSPWPGGVEVVVCHDRLFVENNSGNAMGVQVDWVNKLLYPVFPPPPPVDCTFWLAPGQSSTCVNPNPPLASPYVNPAPAPVNMSFEVENPDGSVSSYSGRLAMLPYNPYGP